MEAVTGIHRKVLQILKEKGILRESYYEELNKTVETLSQLVESNVIDYEAFAKVVSEATGLPFEPDPKPADDSISFVWDEEMSLYSFQDMISNKFVPIEGGFGIVYPLPQMIRRAEKDEEQLFIISFDRWKELLKQKAIDDEDRFADYLARNKETDAVLFLLVQAVALNASDVHILPASDSVRLRIDGVLKTYSSLNGKGSELAKVIYTLTGKQPPDYTRSTHSIRLAGDDLFSEKAKDLVEQADKRIKNKLLLLKGVDFRVEIVPHPHAGSDVLSTTMRVLDRTKTFWKLDSLGLQPEVVDRLRSIVMRRGVILVTGETGSGKTTTCYSLLSEIDAVSNMLVTIEDPIEFKNRFWKQLERKEVGDRQLSFATLISSVLRQDPDVIFVGEVRDAETAELLFQAANTGHAVISTIHTNSAYDTIIRLTDLLSGRSSESDVRMKLSSFLKAILSQRLLRRTCPFCAEEVPVPHSIYSDLNRRTAGLLEKMNLTTHYVGKGCKMCNGTGFRGRVLVSEFIEFTPEVSTAVAEGRLTKEEFSTLMNSQKYDTLVANAVKKAKAGILNLEEVARKL